MRLLWILAAVSAVWPSFAQTSPPTLIFPRDFAVSSRILQDFQWQKSVSYPNGLWDFRMERKVNGSWELFYEIHDLPQSGMLTENNRLSVCRFDPAVHLKNMADIVRDGIRVPRAPVWEPGYQYRWSVRINQSPWSTRTLQIVRSPNYRLGLDTHLTFPGEWFKELLGREGQTAEELGCDVMESMPELVADLNNLNLSFLFEGAMQAWGRDAFRLQNQTFAGNNCENPEAFAEAENMIRAVTTQTNPKPQLIANFIYNPLKIPASGQPVLGRDYFSMFDFTPTPNNPDSPFFEVTGQGSKSVWHLKRAWTTDDPRLRPVYTHRVMKQVDKDTRIEWPFVHLRNMWFDVVCQYQTWRRDPNNEQTEALRRALIDYTYAINSVTFEATDDLAPIRAKFEDYIYQSVKAMPEVSYWHFMNEANGNWHVDPHLYTYQLTMFADQVRRAAAENGTPAKVMIASLHAPAMTAVDGTDIPAYNPNIFWLKEIARRLKDLKRRDPSMPLPFDAVGLNFFFEKGGPNGHPFDSVCLGQNTAPLDNCGEIEEQECRFDYFKNFYLEVYEVLEDLADTFDTAVPEIIIKETNPAYHKQIGEEDIFDINVAVKHLPRTVSFLHELGNLHIHSPALFGAATPTTPARILHNIPSQNQIKGVLWFHHYLGQKDVNLLEKDDFPRINRSVLWDAVAEHNHQPKTTPQIQLPSIFYNIDRGESIHIGTESPREGLYYAWSPTDGLDDPSAANPLANPTNSTTYTVTVTNTTGQSIQREVRINVAFPNDDRIVVLNAGQGIYPGNTLQVGIYLNDINPNSELMVQLILPNTYVIPIGIIHGGQGRVDWCVDFKLEPGTDYYIRVKESSTARTWSGDLFEVLPAVWQVTAPSGVQRPGEPLHIEWDWLGSEFAMVQLKLYQSGRFIRNIGDPMLGSERRFTWENHQLPEGHGYRVHMVPFCNHQARASIGPQFQIRENVTVTADWDADAEITAPWAFITFQSLSTSTGKPIDSLAWDFNNDGIIDAYGETISHRYQWEGVFTACLTASVVDGLSEISDKECRQIEVRRPRMESPDPDIAVGTEAKFCWTQAYTGKKTNIRFDFKLGTTEGGSDLANVLNTQGCQYVNDITQWFPRVYLTLNYSAPGVSGTIRETYITGTDK